jgi:hypothetical protein
VSVDDDSVYTVARVRPARPRRAASGPSAGEIIAALRRWYAQYGESPTLADWEPSRARRQGQAWRAERWEAGDWPSLQMVRRRFGTMAAALRAAGLPVRRSPSRTRRHLQSPDEVLDAIRAWNVRYGEPPAMTDWDPARARATGQLWRIDRYYQGDWPSIVTVRHHFGTLNRAIVAAGLRPRVPGERTASGRLPSGPGEDDVAPMGNQQLLALRVRAVAIAQHRNDVPLLIAALEDLATVAHSWADQLRADPLEKGS